MTSLKSFVENQHHLRLIRENRHIWLVPTVVIGVLGTLFALVRPPVWVASQGLIVRDEAVGELGHQGRFESTDDRRAAQELLLEVARNRQVVVSSLKLVTPTKKQKPGFPQEGLVRDWQKAITVTAGKGAELGESDVIYLRVEGRTAPDAVRNTAVVARHLGHYLNVLRNRRLDSVIQELEQKLKLAVADRTKATQQLETMERTIGSDLGELRTLNQSGTGDSNLRTGLSQIKSDLRKARSGHSQQMEQLQFLRGAVQDPRSIVATPNGVLGANPSLRRLKDGLVDAQLRLADLMGKMNRTHPSVKAAEIAVQEIHGKLRSELRTAIRSAEAELRVTQALINSYERQLKAVNNRLNSLAAMRARYTILENDLQDRNAQVKEIKHTLADSRASRASAGSLITLVDRPDPGDSPVGPGRLTLMLAAWLGGFFVGVGFLFLIAPPDGPATLAGVGRRLSDRLTHAGLSFGRRSSDRSESVVAFKRRNSDENEPAAWDRRASDLQGNRQETKQRRGTPPMIVPLDVTWAQDKPLTDPE